ncbi:hypothetical protein [Cellulomonas sp. ATA003]|nr:hypothetical protein [Cellulomonas sp. ATA003]WNB85952.1 hypothetical protein REH70_01150 [Cellulomonas sp. ATA003]
MGVADVGGTHAEHHGQETSGHEPFEQRGHAAWDGKGLAGTTDTTEAGA